MEFLTIAGTIVRDAELRTTQGGEKVLSFTVVVDRGKDRDGNRRDGGFYDASLWGKRAESLHQYLTKGTRVCITGRPSARVHEGKAYLQCSVNELTLLGGGRERNDSRDEGSYGSGSRPSSNDFTDEIPFAPEWRA